MSRWKGFLLGFCGTLAVIMPIYLLFAALGLRESNVAPADGAKLNVPMAKPVSQDAKTLLVISGAENPDAFVLLRFDALTNKICAVALAGNTVLLREGQPVLLRDAAASAGPEQAAACIRETLDITVDDYLQVDAALLAEIAAPLGSGEVRLANYLGEAALGQLKLAVPGVETLNLSPAKLLEVLQSGLVPEAQLPAIRADGYLAFLRAGASRLDTTLVTAMRKYVSRVSTSISATDIYDYERVLKFLVRQEAEFKTGVLPGQNNNGRFELSPQAPEVAKEYLA